MDDKGAASVDVSVVSHGHGVMLVDLVRQLLDLPEVSKVFVTVNIPERLSLPCDQRIFIVSNETSQGFGANHNAAFLLSNAPFFCVLNPDVVFIENPFPALLCWLESTDVSLAVPVVVNSNGDVEDSLRHFMTPWRMLKRVLKLSSGAYEIGPNAKPFCPEWAAGMFMLFRRDIFLKLRGFDERYFMYCEDADICTRLWVNGGRLVAVPEARVVHQAQRASRRRINHLRWHLASMIRYIGRFFGRLPSVNNNLPIQ